MIFFHSLTVDEFNSLVCLELFKESWKDISFQYLFIIFFFHGIVYNLNRISTKLAVMLVIKVSCITCNRFFFYPSTWLVRTCNFYRICFSCFIFFFNFKFNFSASQIISWLQKWKIKCQTSQFPRTYSLSV